MSFHNDGSEEYAHLNRWTRYLHTALLRARARYMDRRSNILNAELQAKSSPEDPGWVPVLENIPDETPSPEEQVQINHDIPYALSLLSARSRQIVTMKVMEDMTFAQISGRLGLKAPTVAAIYYKALKEMGLWLNSHRLNGNP